MNVARGARDAGPLRPTRIQSVSRASRALLAIADSSDGSSATEIAELLGVSLPTAFHLLSTLVDEGLLAKDTRRYYLGAGAVRIAEAVTGNLAVSTSLRAPLRWLAEETLETAYLAVWRHGEVVVVASIEGAHAVKVEGLGVGFAENAHARASGKVLLATVGPEALDAYIATHELHAVTPNAITDEQTLRTELDKTRDRGYAIDDEEFQEGVVCLGVPIESDGVVYGTYTLSIPVGRARANRQRYLSALRDGAAQAVRGLAVSASPSEEA